MEEDVSLARSQALRRKVLLAHPRSGVSGEEPTGGAKGKKTAGTTEGAKGAKTGGAKKKGKSNAKAKDRNGKGGRPGGLHYSLGRAIRETKSRDIDAGRSAKQLDIEWPDERCEDSPQTKAHYWKDTNRAGSGSIFTCQHCLRIIWLPGDFYTARIFTENIQHYGYQKAYWKMLDKHPAAKKLVAKLQDIRYILQVAKPEHQAIIVSAIMQDMDYPYAAEEPEPETHKSDLYSSVQNIQRLA